MNIDGIVLAKIKNELLSYLPFKISKIMDISKTEIAFVVQGKMGKKTLLMSFHSDLSYLSLNDNQYNTFKEPSNFTMVLRKYLLNGSVIDIKQENLDRYLIFTIKNKNDLYDDVSYKLSIELMGKYANLILVNSENIILDALKRISPFDSDKRSIMPNIKFSYPAKQDKQDPFKELKIVDDYVLNFAGFSKSLEAEVKYLLNNQSIKEIQEKLINSNSLYISDDNSFHIIPLTNLKKSYKEYSLFDGLNKLAFSYQQNQRIEDIAGDLKKLVKKQIKKQSSKISAFDKQRQDALNYQHFKECGDLLYLYENLEQKAMTSVTIQDYNDNNITIALNPLLSVKDNANKYYTKYKKLKKSLLHIDELKEKAKQELEYFTLLELQLNQANYNDALDIKEELLKLNYIKSEKNNRITKARKTMLYHIKYENVDIYYGKNNIQNNYLTFDFAFKDDLWLHVKDYHGAHVIIKDSEPCEKVLRFACNIAAYYSAARNASSVGVDYTLVKNVKKIKGSKLGFVSIKNQKTIFIDPYKDDLFV